MTNVKKFFWIIPLILSLIFIPVTISAVIDDFTTDKSLYHKGDQLTISGTVSYDSEIPFVTILIYTPGKSNFADSNTVPVNSDGSFSAVFPVDSATWTTDGVYTIQVSYDGNMEKTIEYKEYSVTPSDPDIIEYSDTTPTKRTIDTVAGSGAPGCEDTSIGCFHPNILEIDVGAPILMTNSDSAAHTFTSGTPETGPGDTFDSGLIMPNSSFEWTPSQKGEYPYFCMVHPWMVGTIMVDQDFDTPSIPDDGDGAKNLKKQIKELKTENRELKREIKHLENQIEELKRIINKELKNLYEILTK